MKKKHLSFLVAVTITATTILNPFVNKNRVLADELNTTRVESLASTNEETDTNYIYLSDLNYESGSRVSHGEIKKNTNIGGGQIRLLVEGELVHFNKGMGAHANSTLIYNIADYSNTYTRFVAHLGVDYSQKDRGNGVKFKISISDNGKNWVDIKETQVVGPNNSSIFVDLDIKGAKYLRLIANDNGADGNDHSVYANARIVKTNYDLNSENYQTIKRLAEYDEEIRKHSVEDNYTNNKKLLQQREIVRRLGFNTMQNNITGNKEAEETFDWLFNDEVALGLAIESGNVTEGGRFITALTKLYTNYKDCLGDSGDGLIYKKMLIALATGWSSDSGTSALVFNMDLPTFDVVGRFKIMKDFYDNNKLARKEEFKTYNMELMRMIMNNQMANEDLLWLNNYATKKYPNDLGKRLNFWNYGIAYKTINLNQDFIYNVDNKERFDEKYSLTENNISYGEKGKHNLWMLFEVGGVCWNSSRFGQNLNKAFGLPSIGVYQPWHEAVLEYKINGDGHGVWSINNNIGGWQKARTVWGANKPYRTLLDWGNKYFSDKASDNAFNGAYMLLGQSALENPNFEKSYYYNLQANSYTDSQDKIRIYKMALDVLDINLDSYEGLINEYKKANVSPDEWRALANKVIDKYTYYPYALVDLIKTIRPYLASEDRAEIDMARNIALNKATTATKNDVVQFNECRDIAKSIMGIGKVDLASFSFSGENANKIIINNNYGSFTVPVEYSLDGGKTWIMEKAGTSVIQLTEQQVKTINDKNDIKVRLVGSVFTFTIDIKKGASPDTSNLYRNNANKRLEGKVTNLEYSLDDGTTWKDYTEQTVFEEYQIAQVRYKSTGVHLYSDDLGYTFMPDNERISIIGATGFLDAVVLEALKNVDITKIEEILVTNKDIKGFVGNDVEKSIVSTIKEYTQGLIGDYSIYINNFDKSAKNIDDLRDKNLIITYKLNDKTPTFILKNGVVDGLN